MFSGKLMRNNKGTSLVIMSFMLTAILGMSAVVIDIGRVIIEKQRLQNAVDSAVLAAAQELPNTVKAVEIANEYIKENGYDTTDISITFSDSDSAIDIKGVKETDFMFARILGFDSKTVECSAGAAMGSVGEAFDYVLFSGSTTRDFVLNGAQFYANGSSHANCNFIANGSDLTITGACEAVKNITINGSQIKIDDRRPNASFIDMPDFSETIKAQAEKAGTSYPSGKSYCGSCINVDDPIYVNGDLTVNGSSFKGKGCILATGNIIFNGSNLNNSTSDSVCFYSKNGSIIVNGSNAELSGIVYAPNGTIALNGSQQTIYGRVIGQNITFNGSGITIIGNANDLKSIPSTGVKLIR